MRNKPILCVDFDGVVHAYTSPWTNAETISDGPVPGALKWLWAATEWFNVQIYSSRSKEPAGIAAMKTWMLKHSRAEFDPDHPMCMADDAGEIGPVYPIGFAHEKPAAFLTIDDRCVEFDGDWSALDPADMLSFKPWNKRDRAA